jgi:NADH:ubiquinone oxidoreductase subunit H
MFIEPVNNFLQYCQSDISNMTVLEVIVEVMTNICYYINSSAFIFLFNNFTLNYSTSYTLIITTKIVISLFVLILVRGAVPRYRYDFLTKLG